MPEEVVEPQMMNDWDNYAQYLRYHQTIPQWFVEWTGPKKKHRQLYYFKGKAWKQYQDVTRAGFEATTNAQPTPKKTVTIK